LSSPQPGRLTAPRPSFPESTRCFVDAARLFSQIERGHSRGSGVIVVNARGDADASRR